jgi:hypothetical protein
MTMQGSDNPRNDPAAAGVEDGKDPVLERIAKAPLSQFRLPADTAPTWEVELLLSGATLFTLMQLPEWLNAQFGFWTARLGETGLYVASFAMIYAKVIVFAIITTLIVHLLTRGMWVAGIGLRSVYPRGIRWRSLRYGVRFRAHARSRLPTLKRIIDRSDDFASQMFAVAALMVVMTLFSLMGTMLILAVAWLASALMFGGDYLGELSLLLIAIIVLSQTIASFADRRAKQRGRAQRATLRWVFAVYRIQLWMPFARLSSALMLVFTSHFGSVRGTIVLVLVMYALIAASVFDLAWERDGMRVGAGGPLAVLDGEKVIVDANYADRRHGEARHALEPYIDSVHAQGDYLQLVIPFHPRRHPQALEAACPGVFEATVAANTELETASEQLGSSGEKSTQREDVDRIEQVRQSALSALLTCASGLHAPKIDGVALDDIELQLMPAADQQQLAFVAWLPLHELKRGRHVLQLERLPKPAAIVPFGRKEPQPPGVAQKIPFWR